ncbi:hypothetical protein [Haladaptatus halobius]|uniref:hypothetical protein n=1 Tax=Haladaptatus halobius TaxID=2884875 RepID=UPI001D0A7E65|nr:hypothetical protein [Haladaptatus halobius]
MAEIGVRSADATEFEEGRYLYCVVDYTTVETEFSEMGTDGEPVLFAPELDA